MFVMNQWYVGGFSWELGDKPLARTLLGRHLVLFRTGSGAAGALEDRCCHRSLPLSCGTLEAGGIRCGYHGLLFSPAGKCLEIPGQQRIPDKARVESFQVVERNSILWIWFGVTAESQPDHEPPEYRWHDDARYEFRGDVYHYDAPYQLIHDNLLDLSHLGYVHLRTIGGNPGVHMNAQMKVEGEGDKVRVVRHMLDSAAPTTYSSAWPFRDRIDRWQEIDFEINHMRIWTGAVDANSEDINDPERGGFHMRGLHCITPETETTAHYFWTMSTNRPPSGRSNLDLVFDQTALTFEEDKVIIEDQYRNLCRFGTSPQMDIHVDAGPNRARRIIARRIAEQTKQAEHAVAVAHVADPLVAAQVASA